MFVDFNILNQLGSPAINSNTFANRPAAGQTGRLFVSTDTFEIYRDNGTTWDLIGGPGSSTITGTGTATQVAYFTSSQAIGSSANLFWDNTQGFLGVATATPTARIEAVKTDGIGLFANYTTNAGTGSSATAIWAKNITNSSGYGAVIEETTPNNTGGQYPLLIKHSLSSGTAAVGMGTGVHWQLPDDAGTFKTTQLTIETTDAAAATYKTRYRFNVQNNGSSTAVAYLNATGLGLFTATPGAALDIHSTGTIAQLNSTGTTNNTYLAFQRTGATTFSIGDTYNGGSNYFRIFGNTLNADIVRIFAATGESFFTSTETYSSGNSIGVAVQNNLTIPNGVNVGLAALGGVNSNLNLTLQGSTTVANTGRQGLEGSTSINFTGAGTLTMTQGSTVRAFSALSSVYAFNGSEVGTITHLAGLRICFPDNVGSAVNITNNYALLINNQTTGTGTVTYTNRWGIYQEGTSDLNYFAANMLLGSTVNNGNKLQVTGNADFTGNVGIGGIATGTYGKLSVFGGISIKNDNNAKLEIGRYSSGFANSYIKLGSNSNSLRITDNNDQFDILELTNAGNLGLGVTPSSWAASPYKALQIGTGIGTGAIVGRTDGTNEINFGVNWVYTGGASLSYIGSSYATNYYQKNGEHIWQTAPSGTAGNAITFTPAMTLDASSNLMINGTTASGRLTVTGVANGQTIRTEHTANYSFLYSTINNANAVAFDNLSGELRMYTGGSARIAIPTGGNVLIGTITDAGEKLQVNGVVNSIVGKYRGSTTLQIVNNSTNYTLFNQPVAGMMTMRDNTNGGSQLWSLDPNGGAILVANSFVAFPSAITITYNSGSGIWEIQKSAGSTITVAYAIVYVG